LFGIRKSKVEARFQKQQGTTNASHTKAKNTGLQEGNGGSIRLRINSEASEVKKNHRSDAKFEPTKSNDRRLCKNCVAFGLRTYSLLK
jgi:hypothetical protein